MSVPSGVWAEKPPVFRVTTAEAESAIRDALMAQDVGDDIMVSILGVENGDLAVASYPLKMEVDELKVDRVSGRWNAMLYFYSDERNLPPKKLYGRYEEIVDIPVMTRKVAAGEVIATTDMEMQSLPASRVRKNMLTDVKDIVGKTPRTVISPGRPIRSTEIINPITITKGSLVQMNFRSGNMQIQAVGEALEDGGIGDMIRLRNTDSRAVVRGEVEGPGKVQVFGSTPAENRKNP